MDLNSINFIFIFLPLLLLLFLIVRPGYRKWLILIASGVFYIAFQKQNFLFILSLILINYFLLMTIRNNEPKPKLRRSLFWFTIIANILVWLFFKVFTNKAWGDSQFLPDIYNLPVIQDLVFPLGLSYILFQVISCLTDTYKAGESSPKNLGDYLSYLLFFPKIVLGPIMKFNLFEAQFNHLIFSWERAAEGSKRFIRGLAKKVIIADQLAGLVNAGFGLNKPTYPTSDAWIVLVALFIQIYYDFSGYIDMGIGIAQMLGFNLPENFNAPYLSKSITDFWRRWHMTLLAWMREYVFYPLEYKRRRVKFLRIESHTILIFLLTGLWHGLTLNYLVWGLLQGIAIIYENSRYGQWIKKLPSFVQHFYLIGFVMASWVIFRSPTIIYALRFFKRLFVVNQQIQLPFSMTQPIPIINNSIFIVIILGIIGLLPFNRLVEKPAFAKVNGSPITRIAVNLLYFIILILSITLTSGQSIIPSIYGSY
jgi:alginate O-acetyltransferase complex protein AlgI